MKEHMAGLTGFNLEPSLLSTGLPPHLCDFPVSLALLIHFVTTHKHMAMFITVFSKNLASAYHMPSIYLLLIRIVPVPN